MLVPSTGAVFKRYVYVAALRHLDRLHQNTARTDSHRGTLTSYDDPSAQRLELVPKQRVAHCACAVSRTRPSSYSATNSARD